ncbi:Spexin Spexin hormone [Takifugu flavidus]|uniref:Spexin Spexin hormone n=1 Tax=Takifugu flavidus TaxID=433684 RepID=A0A5C6P9K2_9TELE|nr:Spexin Spexin hormone [Takifugu flavidus]
MPLMVMVLLLTLVAQCWGTPQWRNWSPQAILYLKGAQGHRVLLQRPSRDKDSPAHLGSLDPNQDGLRQPWAPLLLKLLQAAVDEGKAPQRRL